MAELSGGAVPLEGLRLTLAQFRAVAWLRWRILVNNSRRRGGKTELVARLLLYPFAFLLILFPVALAGFSAWYVTMHGSLRYLSLVFWGAFLFAQLLNMNFGQPGTTFDPLELIRFPLALRNYVLLRLSFGLLSPANAVAMLMGLSIFIGVTMEQPGIWPWTLLATGTFAVATVLLSRMIFAWVDRWLSTRRAREVFSILIFAGSLLFQYLNVNYNPGLNHGRHREALQRIRHVQAMHNRLRPWLRWLPPELAGAAIESGTHHDDTQSLSDAALIAAYAAVFLTAYTLRIRSEYQGENLSDAANATYRTLQRSSPAPGTSTLTAARQAPETRGGYAQTLGPLIRKEFLLLRRNTGLLYGVIAPMAMVFLFAGRISLRSNPHWLLLTAVAYAMLGVAPWSYNIFGLEGSGAQLYFLAPVPLRQVFIAKNLMNIGLALLEVLVIMAIVAVISGRPTFAQIVFALLWALATLLLNSTLGNLRSVAAPKKVKPGRSLQRSQSQLSAWVAIGLLGGCASIGFGLQWLAIALHRGWLGLLLICILAAAAAFAYQQSLQGIEAYAMQRRESLFEELGRKM